MASSLADFPVGTPVFRTGDGSYNTVIGVFAGYGTGGSGLDSLFKSDTPANVDVKTGGCLSGGCNCPPGGTTPTTPGRESPRVTTMEGYQLNPLFRSRQYGMSSYQAVPETPDFLFSNERTAYGKKKYGFFSTRLAKKGDLNASMFSGGTTL